MRRPIVLITALALFGVGIVISVVGVWLLLQRDDDSNPDEKTIAPTATSETVEVQRTATWTAPAIVEQATQPPAQTLPAGQMVVYLAAPEGSTGPVGPIGCGNYLVPVTRGDIPPTTTDKQIAYTLTDLFSIKDQFYGQSGLYNTLYQSNLVVERIELDAAGHANIYLTGDYLLAGECTNPLFQAQIEYTARQVASVSSVAVFINGTAIEQLLSGR